MSKVIHLKVCKIKPSVHEKVYVTVTLGDGFSMQKYDKIERLKCSYLITPKLL